MKARLARQKINKQNTNHHYKKQNKQLAHTGLQLEA